MFGEEEKRLENLMQGRAARSHFPWAESEKLRLTNRYKSGERTVNELADEFERSNSAILAQLAALGLIEPTDLGLQKTHGGMKIGGTVVEYLYHFTDERNLPLIREHGLLSLSMLGKKGITPPMPGGNQWSHDEDKRKGLDGYVHLCFKEFHPMEYVAKRDGRIKKPRFLRISTDVLKMEDVMGCSEVANRSGAEIFPIAEAVDKIRLNVLLDPDIDFSIEANQKKHKEISKAEILVPDRIDTKHILSI